MEGAWVRDSSLGDTGLLRTLPAEAEGAWGWEVGEEKGPDVQKEPLTSLQT